MLIIVLGNVSSWVFVGVASDRAETFSNPVSERSQAVI
jgi:hypothetical protein